jgi:N-methylhydantoinase B
MIAETEVPAGSEPPRGAAVTHRAAPRATAPRSLEDPVTTEVIRHGLAAAATQMQIALRRAAFSPIIYEIRDLSCTLYDRQLRLLAQDQSIPSWIGTMNVTIDAILTAVGGSAELEPGDVMFSTYGYDLGSHPQDAVTVVPVFVDTELVGYAAVKAHQMDIGAKDLYCSDTTDNFQEGTIFPGVRLHRNGVRQEDLWRTLLANSRMPVALAGDVTASIAAAEMGARALVELIERHGHEQFFASVEQMFDHGEATMRRLLAEIPNGRYVAHGTLDSNGVTDDEIELVVGVDVSDSEILVDFSDAPPQQAGPINAPWQVAVSCARYTMMFLAGGAARDQLNDGHLRPIAVRTRPGTLFHPVPPAPIFLYNHASRQASDAIIRALADVLPANVRADSGGCLVPNTVWGAAQDGSIWGTGINHSVGQGATVGCDGGGPLIHIAVSGVRTAPAEVLEARFPLLVRSAELAPDSGGAGRYRGGCGLDVVYEFLDDVSWTAILERTKHSPSGLFGGREGRRNRMELTYPDGRTRPIAKVTALPIPKGSILRVMTGGGGGYGPPEERPVEKIERDLRDGYVSSEAAHTDYPQSRGARPRTGGPRCSG